MSIVHHRAIDAIRRRRPTSELPDTEAGIPDTLTLPDVWTDVELRLDRAAIREAMASISGVQREAIELAYFGGLTQTEIAERTGVPLGTVKGRLRLGLQGLRAALLPLGDGADRG
jgi:RNA polymerase sigma-70 factor (ECF subfamily)